MLHKYFSFFFLLMAVGWWMSKLSKLLTRRRLVPMMCGQDESLETEVVVVNYSAPSTRLPTGPKGHLLLTVGCCTVLGV